MFVGIFAWFASLGVKAVLVLVLIASLVGSVSALYFSITHNARVQAQLEALTKRQQEIITDQQKVLQLVEELQSLGTSSTVEHNNEVEAIKEKLKALTEFLNSPEANKGDRPSSEILKRTIQELSK